MFVKVKSKLLNMEEQDVTVVVDGHIDQRKSFGISFPLWHKVTFLHFESRVLINNNDFLALT